ERIFGYESEEVRGERVEALGGEWLGDLLLLEGGARAESREGTLRTRDGEEIETRVTVGEIRDDGEGPAGTVLVARDVRREREAYRALKQSEERFASVFESSPVAISLSTVDDGRLLDVNQRYAELSGYSREELVGSTSRDLGLWEDPDVRERMVEELRETGRIRGLETDARTREGELLRVEVNAELIEVEGEPRVLGLIQDVTERHEAQKRLQHQALHDPVTDLPNRLLFRDRVEHALAGEERRDERTGVLFLDLDRFKRVNDTLGHAAGDELLRSFGRRLREAVREQDTVARIGGDEFAVLLEGLEGEEDARAAVERIQAALEEPFWVDGTELPGTASIGLAYSREGSTVDDLLRESDVAMYRAKKRGGGNRCEVFEPGMEREPSTPENGLRT
ncbi:MAG: diguanylate cyclase domain-containing protein, partial [Gemmatimonadota bacterium]